jgi:hypothetical protein
MTTVPLEPIIKASDMEEDMIKKVKDISLAAVKEYKQEK